MISWFAILALLQAVAFWQIFRRMGLPPWFAIPAALPLLNVLVLFYVAYTPWPRGPRGL